MLRLSENKIKIRLVSSKDVRFLYNIYNENVENGNFFSQKKINYTDHKVWFKKKDKKCLIFICLKTVKVGYIRYDKINKNDYKVSIAIKDSIKKRGIGKMLLEKTLKKINSNKFKVYALVKRSNKVSRKFFLSCNFKMFKSGIYVFKVQK